MDSLSHINIETKNEDRIILERSVKEPLSAAMNFPENTQRIYRVIANVAP